MLRLKQNIDGKRSKNNIVKNTEERIDYKSRNEKAIEYIKYWHYRNDFRVNSFTLDVKEDLLNIL